MSPAPSSRSSRSPGRPAQPARPPCRAESQVYLLSARDAAAAHDWIDKLQTKRSQWIKAESAKDDHSREEGPRLQPLRLRQGGVLSEAGEEDKGDVPGVRRILGQHIAQSGS